MVVANIVGSVGGLGRLVLSDGSPVVSSNSVVIVVFMNSGVVVELLWFPPDGGTLVEHTKK